MKDRLGLLLSLVDQRLCTCLRLAQGLLAACVHLGSGSIQRQHRGQRLARNDIAIQADGIGR